LLVLAIEAITKPTINESNSSVVTGIYTNPQLEEMRRAVEALTSGRGQAKVLEFKTG
jgi:hypothetical protein